MAKKKYATHVTLPTGRRVYVSGKSKADLDAHPAWAVTEEGDWQAQEGLAFRYVTYERVK